MRAISIEQHLAGLRNRHFRRPSGDGLARLLEAWARCVPQPLCAHARPVYCDGRHVLVDADAPLWLAQLRHQSPTLLTRLKREAGLRALESLRGRVRPLPALGPARAAPRPVRLSPRGLEALEGLAQDLAEPTLKEAVLRLLRHARTKGSGGDRQT